jgi:hypothetical protein
MAINPRSDESEKKPSVHWEEQLVDNAELLVGTYAHFGKETGCHLRGYRRLDGKDNPEAAVAHFVVHHNKDTGIATLYPTITYGVDPFIGPSSEAVQAERTLRASAAAHNTEKIDRALYGNKKRDLVGGLAPGKKKRQVSQAVAEKVSDGKMADRDGIMSTVRAIGERGEEAAELETMNKLLPSPRLDTEAYDEAYDIEKALPQAVMQGQSLDQPLYKALNQKIAGKDVDLSAPEMKVGRSVTYLLKPGALRTGLDGAVAARSLVVLEGLIRMYQRKAAKVKSAKHTSYILDDVVAYHTAEHFMSHFRTKMAIGDDGGKAREVHVSSATDSQKLICHIIVFIVYLSPEYTIHMDHLAADLDMELPKLRVWTSYCGVKSSRRNGEEIGKLALPLEVRPRAAISPKKKK